jgi:hypothetical protein
VRLTEVQSGQNVQNESRREDGRGHRQEGGVSKAARELPVSGNTDEAKRKTIERAIKIAGLSDDARAAADAAGLTSQCESLPILFNRDE